MSTTPRKGCPMRRIGWALLVLTLPVSRFPSPAAAQRRAITFDDFIALKVVGDPQVSPDGRWAAYTVTTPSVADNRGVSRIWLADLTAGTTRQFTSGPGSDRQPRWSPDGKTLAFVSSRQGGTQVWLLSLAGGEARKLRS